MKRDLIISIMKKFNMSGYINNLLELDIVSLKEVLNSETLDEAIDKLFNENDKKNYADNEKKISLEMPVLYYSNM